jgi:hypothetical protein
MAISKDKLIFDSTEMSESDNVGSFLRASDGTLITHTDNGGKKSLDVHVANTVAVSATDLDIRDLTAASDSVKIGDGSDFLAINADGSINSVVTATDLDIRNLAFATDSVTAHQGTSPWVVSATDLDIRDLAHTTDSIKIGDGTDLLAVNADGSINVVTPAPDTALAVESIGVTDTGDALPTSPLANRKKMIIQNLGSKAMYIGPSGVTVGTGLRIAAGANVELEIGPSVILYGITDSSQVTNARVFEIA